MEYQTAPGQLKTGDLIPHAEFLDWRGTWTQEKHVLTNQPLLLLLLKRVAKSKTHLQLLEARELQTYFEALWEG